MSIIIIDVGGTKISSAISTDSEIKNINTVPTTKDLLGQVKTIISSLYSSQIKAINIAWAGWITPEGIIARSPHLPVDNLNLQSCLHETFKIAIKVENDANAFTLQEASKFPEAETILGITIGTGIGAGLINNGTLFRGAHNFAAEIGHQQLGQRTAEQWFAGTSNDIQKNSSKRVHLFAEWISNLSLAYDPDLIVIGGSIGINIWGKHIEEIRKIVSQNLDKFPIYPKIICTTDQHAVLRGACLI